jgi:hypothetical protein
MAHSGLSDDSSALGPSKASAAVTAVLWHIQALDAAAAVLSPLQASAAATAVLLAHQGLGCGGSSALGTSRPRLRACLDSTKAMVRTTCW